MTVNAPVSSAPSVDAETVNAPESSFSMVYSMVATVTVVAAVTPSAKTKPVTSAGNTSSEIANVSSRSTTASWLVTVLPAL